MPHSPLQVFIGYDPVEPVAYHVLAHSIIRQSSIPVSITPVALQHFSFFYKRAWDKKQSNEFAFSRFLVPHLCGFGAAPAIWMDADMLVRCDIAELSALHDRRRAVQVVQSIDFRPDDGTKYLGRPQSAYPELEDGTTRKLWSAMMMFTPRWCWNLTPKYVQSMPGLALHQFDWCEKNRLGELDGVWQHVVGHDPYDAGAKIVHWTLGGPWFGEKYAGVDYADEWREEYARMTFAETEK